MQFDQSITGVTVTNVTLAVADDAGNAPSVKFPSKIKQIYLEFALASIMASSTAGNTVRWAIFKNPAGIYTNAQMSPLNLEATPVGQCIRAGQMRTGNFAEGRYVFAGYISIPKRHQVFNETDYLQLLVYTAVDSQICGLCEYLEQS